MADYNQIAAQDAYGHFPPLAGPALTAAAVSTSAAGTFIPVAAGAGTGATVAYGTGQTATDLAGTFQVTAAGTPAAGAIASVFFANPLPALPKAILITVSDATDGDQVGEAANATSITCTGFTVSVATVLVAAEVYNVSYLVIV